MQEEAFEPSQHDLELLREWIKQMPYIPQDYGDQFIASFYRASKGRLQKTKATLEGFCSCGYRFPEIFRGLDPQKKNMQELLEVTYFYEIPRQTEKNETIMGSGVHPGIIDSNKYRVLEIFKLYKLNVLINIKDKECWPRKLIIIVDCKGVPLSIAKDFTPTRVAYLTEALQNGTFGRVQAVHLINVPTVFDWILELFLSFSTEKFKQRIIIDSKCEKIRKAISKDFLPNEYGGTSGTLKELSEQWIAKMSKNRDYLIEEEDRMRKLDHLRPKGAEGDMSLTDTFRKLNVD